jgi:hypothetical protein
MPEAGVLAVARTAAVVRGVASLSPTVATYLPGHRVDGVRCVDDRIEVHIVAAPNVSFPDLARRIRLAVAQRTDQPVDVVFDDVADVDATP